ncbi:MAG: DciA family protein [Patescibacteria group bacterium]|nr:DciA family protein [Patescibacteria group bacterium]
MFKDIKSILSRSIKRAGMGSQVEEKQALEIFKDGIKGLLGADLAKQVKILYIKEKVIVLACLSSQAAKIIKDNERQIFKVINKNIGKIVVERARYLT